MHSLQACAGQAGPCAGQPVHGPESAAGDIGDGEVGQVDVPYVPGVGGGGTLRADALAEKSELVPRARQGLLHSA
jgi:hypothetical protein